MALYIYMYNTWFGDCYRIENNGSNLVVDFGIHSQSIMPHGLTRDDVHKRIAKDILASDNPALVISHFHEDHVSGLLYMMKHMEASTRSVFQKVYIPDIWNITDAPSCISILLLEELLKHSKMTGRIGAVTLFELMRFLCINTLNVVPIKRGQHIEGKRYLALWPDPQSVGDYVNLYFNRLEIDVFPTQLIALAQKLQNLVLERINMSQTDGSTQKLISSLNELEAEFFELNNVQDVAIILAKVNGFGEDVYLNHMGNNISIVFQNTEIDQERRILFTGDLEEKFLKKIASNDDKKCSMYPSYDFIKIPHHGTRGGKGEHYFDFKPYAPKCFMISNGSVNARGNWEICREYGNDVKSEGIKVFCSNSNSCESNPGGRFLTCSCVDNQFVFPNVFQKVY